MTHDETYQTDKFDELVVQDDLSKYTAFKWYGGFTDKDGDFVKVEGYYNDTR